MKSIYIKNIINTINILIKIINFNLSSSPSPKHINIKPKIQKLSITNTIE